MAKIYGDLEVVGSQVIDENLTVTGIITGTVSGTASSANNVVGGGPNQIVYQSASSTTTFLSPTTGALVYTGSALAYTTTPTLTGTNITGVLGQNILSYDPVNSISTDTVVLDTALTNLNNSILNLSAGITIKEADAIAVVNINISNPGTSTFDGTTLTSGQKLFITSQYQTNDAECGIWTFNGSGSALTRASTMNTWNDVVGSQVMVPPSTTYVDGSVWRATVAAGGTLGVTPITFNLLPSGAYVGGTGVTITGNTISIGQAVGVSNSPTFVTVNANLNGNASTASKWVAAKLLAGNSVDGSTTVPFANKFIVQGTTDTGLSAAQFLGALGTGIVKNTTTTGVLSIAVAGDFPTLNQNTTGNAATATNATTATNANNLNTLVMGVTQYYLFGGDSSGAGNQIGYVTPNLYVDTALQVLSYNALFRAQRGQAGTFNGLLIENTNTASGDGTSLTMRNSINYSAQFKQTIGGSTNTFTTILSRYNNPVTDNLYIMTNDASGNATHNIFGTTNLSGNVTTSGNLNVGIGTEKSIFVLAKDTAIQLKNVVTSDALTIQFQADFAYTAYITSKGNGGFNNHKFLFGANSGDVFRIDTLAQRVEIPANTSQIILGTTNTTTVSMASLTASRVVTFPDANSNTVVPVAATANQFLTNITSGGIQTKAQPAFSDLSGTINTTTQITPAIQTWAVTIGDGTNNFTTPTASGAYTRIGNQITIWVFINWSSKGSATGQVMVSLPFAISASIQRAVFTLGYVSNVTVLSPILISGSTGQTAISLYTFNSGSPPSSLTAIGFGGSGEIQITGTYYI